MQSPHVSIKFFGANTLHHKVKIRPSTPSVSSPFSPFPPGIQPLSSPILSPLPSPLLPPPLPSPSSSLLLPSSPRLVPSTSLPSLRVPASDPKRLRRAPSQRGRLAPRDSLQRSRRPRHILPAADSHQGLPGCRGPLPPLHQTRGKVPNGRARKSEVPQPAAPSRPRVLAAASTGIRVLKGAPSPITALPRTPSLLAIPHAATLARRQRRLTRTRHTQAAPRTHTHKHTPSARRNSPPSTTSFPEWTSPDMATCCVVKPHEAPHGRGPCTVCPCCALRSLPHPSAPLLLHQRRRANKVPHSHGRLVQVWDEHLKLTGVATLPPHRLALAEPCPVQARMRGVSPTHTASACARDLPSAIALYCGRHGFLAFAPSPCESTVRRLGSLVAMYSVGRNLIALMHASPSQVLEAAVNTESYPLEPDEVILEVPPARPPLTRHGFAQSLDRPKNHRIIII